MEIICPFCKQTIKMNCVWTTYSCDDCFTNKPVHSRSYLFMFSFDLRDESLASITIFIAESQRFQSLDECAR